MKPPAVTPIRETGGVTVAVTGPTDHAERELQWIDEMAALLPKELRLGWYKNVRPWLCMLPPDDEVAHLAYSMGYLALVTRSTPELIAAERAKLAALSRTLIEEMTAAAKTTEAYHQKLNDRLNALPGEITKGLSPAATEILDAVKEQFLESGISEAGRQLKEQGDRLRQVVSGQNHVLAEFREQMKDSQSHVTWVLNRVTAAADSAKKSIDLWNREMRQVQWIYLGLVLLIGVLLGALCIGGWCHLRMPAARSTYQRLSSRRPRLRFQEGKHGMYRDDRAADQTVNTQALDRESGQRGGLLSELLTIPEVTKALRVSKTTVLRLVSGDRTASAKLPAIRIGRRILVRRETLEAFVRESEGLDSAA